MASGVKRSVLGFARLGLVGALVGCGPASPEPPTDLLERLAAGVFMEYGATARLGETRKQGELPDDAIWAALPVEPVAGWRPPSRRGWHPVGRRAVLEYRFWEPGPLREPTLHLQFQLGPKAPERQSIDVLVRGSSVGRVELSRGFNDLRFPAPALASGDPISVELLFDPPLVRQGFRAPPSMLVGFGVIDGADNTSAAVASAGRRALEDGLLRLSGDGLLVASVDPPSGTAELALEIRCPEGPGTVRLALLDRVGIERARLDLGPCRRRWRRESIPLGSLDEPISTLSLEVLGAGEPGGVEIRRARWIVASGPRVGQAEAWGAPSERMPAATGGRPDELPDVLLIVLDAARAKHFGFFGYERDTTPNLDRLAAESLVFEQAFAECPNTSCSIPSLITGVPFMNLGTVFHGKKLPEEVTTLAEYLKPLGYRAVSFSANPNNAVSRNSHQGFDYFERLAGAHYQAKRAAEVIEEQAADQPLYLQLHFLPPHQPYMPSEEFDLFTDPAYEGVVEPRIGLRRYSAGLATFEEVDVAQLVGLYDGNLRMVDDAVEEVFDAMRRTGRWTNTLVVLTSDHGEAFGEHDTFQHNSTVHDEMLHVALVLRLPGGEARPHVDTDSPVALADIVPTVLGYLAIEPRPEVWGLDLLDPGRSAGGPRFLFHRTYHRNRPLLAIRDARWKAITGRALRRPELYDLVNDPNELENLASRRPAHYSGLMLRLRDFLVDWEARVPESVEDVELSPAEVRLLRSLGYVE